MKWQGLILALLLAVVPWTASAQNVSISAKVDVQPPPPVPIDTVVNMRGIAYPNTQVSIERDGTLLVSVPADPLAKFDVSLANQPTGTHTYIVSGKDAKGRPGSSLSFTLTVTPGTTTTITGIFLGPTIEADKETATLDETITILGITAPESDVTIYVSSEETKTFKTKSGTDGTWTKQILASDIGIGDHNARAKAVAPTTEVSNFSSTVPFSVTDKKDPCSGKNRADINCDGKVNLVDFSIMMFYWKQRDPANKRADINRDRVVNLTDFSILLFNWTGNR